MKLSEVKIGHVYKDTYPLNQPLFLRVIFYDKERERFILLSQNGDTGQIRIMKEQARNEADIGYLQYIGEDFPCEVKNEN